MVVFWKLNATDTDCNEGFAGGYHRRAIALDPNYALAYAGLADCSVFRAQDQSGRPEAVAQAEASSKRALELDPLSAEAHSSLGLTLSYQKMH